MHLSTSRLRSQDGHTSRWEAYWWKQVQKGQMNISVSTAKSECRTLWDDSRMLGGSYHKLFYVLVLEAQKKWRLFWLALGLSKILFTISTFGERGRYECFVPQIPTPILFNSGGEDEDGGRTQFTPRTVACSTRLWSSLGLGTLVDFKYYFHHAYCANEKFAGLGKLLLPYLSTQLNSVRSPLYEIHWRRWQSKSFPARRFNGQTSQPSHWLLRRPPLEPQ